MSAVKLNTKHYVDLDLLCACPIVLDLGACQGQFAENILSLRPKAIVHCFEPSKSNFKLLLNVPGIIPYFGAVVGFPIVKYRFVEYIGRKVSQKGHLIDRKEIDSDFSSINYTVPCYSISSIIEYVLRPNFKIDYIKMDIEGSEMDVTRSIVVETNATQFINQIAIETHKEDDHREIIRMLSPQFFIAEDVGDELLFINKALR